MRIRVRFTSGKRDGGKVCTKGQEKDIVSLHMTQNGKVEGTAPTVKPGFISFMLESDAESSFDLGSPLAIFRGLLFLALCSGLSPGSAQGTLLYDQRFKPGLVGCNISTSPQYYLSSLKVSFGMEYQQGMYENMMATQPGKNWYWGFFL